MVDLPRRYRNSLLLYVFEQFVEPRQIYGVVSSVSLGSNIFHILCLVCLCSPEGLVKLKPVQNQYKPRESLQGKKIQSWDRQTKKNCQAGGKKGAVVLNMKFSLCSSTILLSCVSFRSTEVFINNAKRYIFYDLPCIHQGCCLHCHKTLDHKQSDAIKQIL